MMGKDLADRKTSSRNPSIAFPTSLSVAPSAYISAVSIKVNPASMPKRNAPISSSRRRGSSAMCHVP